MYIPVNVNLDGNEKQNKFCRMLLEFTLVSKKLIELISRFFFVHCEPAKYKHSNIYTNKLPMKKICSKEVNFKILFISLIQKADCENQIDSSLLFSSILI